MKSQRTVLKPAELEAPREVRGQGWEMNASLPAGKQSLHQGFPSVASDRWFARKAAVKNVNDALGATRGGTAPAARRPLNQLQRRRCCLHFQSGIGGAGAGGCRQGLMGLRGCAAVMLKAASRMNI